MDKKIIDISHHQGDIDWSKASKEVSLAIIRTQYGTSTIDRKYEQNIGGCQKYNIPYGVYIYVTFKNKTEAMEQAKDFYNRTYVHKPLFYVVDVEESFGASAKNIVQGTQAFVDYLKSKNVRVGLYTGHHFYKPYQMDTVKNYDFLWIPRYSGTSAPGKKPDFVCDLWQYTDKGFVKGIKGNVDLNKLNGDKQLSWFINKNEGELTMSQYAEINKRLEVIESALGLNARPVAATHKEAWEWATKQGLLDGKNPQKPLTREQLATVEYRKAHK